MLTNIIGLMDDSDENVRAKLLCIYTYLDLKNNFTTIDALFVGAAGSDIGAGNFGKVMKIKIGDKDVALKTLKRFSWAGYEGVCGFLDEMKIHAKVKHENIIECHAVCLEPENLGIIMEFAAFGTLYDALHKNKNIQRSPVFLISIALSITKGLGYLHDMSIMHGDMKTQNVLLTDRGAKLSDFGCAQDLSSKSSKKPLCGTQKFFAPEIFQSSANGVTKARDIYAFAYVLWELESGRESLLGFSSIIDLQGHISGGGREKLLVQESVFSPLISRCWAQRAENRPNIREVAACLNSQQLSL